MSAPTEQAAAQVELSWSFPGFRRRGSLRAS
ncbi:hypothetical protein CYA_0219 [Synechococcus sp. JA-3-3Ab]|nr:hypothetical protein CYA_0219 [Synechococcus sp. JA-3-3Ab]